MTIVKCRGGCGKSRETPTLNKTRAVAGHTTVSPWTCDECAQRIARRKTGVPRPKEEKKDIGFRLVPGKRRTALADARAKETLGEKAPAGGAPESPEKLEAAQDSMPPASNGGAVTDLAVNSPDATTAAPPSSATA
jgi:hypothetical protein